MTENLWKAAMLGAWVGACVYTMGAWAVTVVVQRVSSRS